MRFTNEFFIYPLTHFHTNEFSHLQIENNERCEFYSLKEVNLNELGGKPKERFYVFLCELRKVNKFKFNSPVITTKTFSNSFAESLSFPVMIHVLSRVMLLNKLALL